MSPAVVQGECRTRRDNDEMVLSAAQLNRATLHRQLLLRREELSVAEATRRIVAVQAQQAASPYLALWNRVADFDPAELDAALDDYAVVKATLLRITLHMVTVEDYRPFREAMEPTIRGARLDSRFTATGHTLSDADALVPDLLEFAVAPRTTAEIDAWLTERFAAPPSPGLRRAWRGYTPLWHVPLDVPWSFHTKASYVAPKPHPEMGQDTAAAGLARVVRRYLEGFGPASISDIAQFALIQKSRARAAVADLGDQLRRLESTDGTELFDVTGGVIPKADVAAPARLLPMWDSILLSYADRSRVIPPDYRRIVIRQNGDVLPTLLVDGYVAGVWRATESGIEATAFHALPDEAWRQLANEAKALSALLSDRDPRPYSRFDHWWPKLPNGENRLLT